MVSLHIRWNNVPFNRLLTIEEVYCGCLRNWGQKLQKKYRNIWSAPSFPKLFQTVKSETLQRAHTHNDINDSEVLFNLTVDPQ